MEAGEDLTALGLRIKKLEKYVGVVGTLNVKNSKNGHMAVQEASNILKETSSRLAAQRDGLSLWILGSLHSLEESLLVWHADFRKVALPLGADWQFPSDHLPVGVHLEKHGLNLATWNVLNNDRKHMAWALDGTQGLKDSMICHLHDKGLAFTRRDGEVIRKVRRMISHPLFPKHLVCLQECSDGFLSELQTELFLSGALKTIVALGQKNTECFVYDPAVLDYVEHLRHHPYSGKHGERSLLEARFKTKNDWSFRVFNVHLPGQPHGPARAELADFLISAVSSCSLATFVAGDFNFSEASLFPLLKEGPAKVNAGLQKIKFMSGKYPTSMAPSSLVGKCIDHVIYLGPEEVASVPLLSDEVLEGCGQPEALLKLRMLE